MPASSRAKRVSLGALAALTVGPAVGLASGHSGHATAGGPGPGPEPATTTEHLITLSYGSEGRQVKLLQQALGSIKVDGIFGPETEAAVRSFQASKGLTVDGVVGPLTTAALRSALAGKAMMSDFKAPLAGEGEGRSSAEAGTAPTSEGAAPVPAAEPATYTGEAESDGGTAAAPAAEGAGSEGVSSEGATSGQAADATTAATAAGGTGASEVEAPGGASAAAAATASAESAAANASLAAVQRLQAALHLPVDGDFGPETEAAVRRLQARHGLAVDGIVGPQTWRAIGVASEQTLTPPPSALPQPTPAAAPAGADANAGLTPGSGGTANPIQVAPVSAASAVEWLQAALHVPVDGEFGPETEAAVRRLQARHGLPVDGVVGPQTWALIGVENAPTLTPPPSAVSQTPAGAPGAISTAGGGEAEGVVARVIAAADEIATRPYVYGGGHGSFESVGYDCSGSVSYALHGGGLLGSPEDSSELECYGEPGPGRYITIYANAEHAWMTIDGRRFDTVALAEDGSRWGGAGDDGGGFVVRHPDGL